MSKEGKRERAEGTLLFKDLGRSAQRGMSHQLPKKKIERTSDKIRR